MENIKFVPIAIIILFVIITLFKIISLFLFKCNFSKKEIFIDSLTFIIVFILIWLTAELYQFINVDIPVIKLLFGLLFFAIIPYLVLWVRRKIYNKLNYSLIHENIILHIGYYYMVLIVSLVLLSGFMKLINII